MPDLTINPADWQMDLGADGSYPFVEDEHANITGLGHQDKAEFAAAVNRYDAAMNGEPYPEDEQWNASYVVHKWAVLREHQGEPALFAVVDGEPVTADTTGAVAITTLWGQR
jgi:hypothetical protein